jgi:hypothetical protein
VIAFQRSRARRGYRLARLRLSQVSQNCECLLSVSKIEFE